MIFFKETLRLLFNLTSPSSILEIEIRTKYRTKTLSVNWSIKG